VEFILEYWQEIALAIMVLDKVVAATPVKWDDLILTSIKSVLSTIKPKV
jgi:hypothetical protein